MIWSSYSFAFLIVLGLQCGYSKNQAVDESGRMFFHEISAVPIQFKKRSDNYIYAH